MADGNVRDVLAVAIHATMPDLGEGWSVLFAEHLTPVVERLQRQAAAKALREAAAEAHAEAYNDGRLPWQVLRNRADELDPS